MKRAGILVVAALTSVIGLSSSARAAQVNFEDPAAQLTPAPWGANYGHTPGQLVLSEDGIDVSVKQFFLGASYIGFFKAEPGGVYASLFDSTALSLDNISARFDFTGLGFEVDQVTIEYQEFGGGDNFRVNDWTGFELTSMMGIPTNVAPGVTASVADGVITLNGPITSFQIGGQELGIDNIVAVPEPGTLLLLGLGGLTLLRRRTLRR